MPNASIPDMLAQSSFWVSLMRGLGVTLVISIIAIVLAFIFGIIVGVMRYSKVPVISQLAAIYIDFLRNIPLLLLMFAFFLIGQMQNLPAATIALTVFTTAVVAEVVRGGLNSIPKGQWEASRSQGMTYLQILRHIVLPQAVTKMIPPMVSQFVTVIKDSAFAIQLGVLELSNRATILQTQHTSAGQILVIFAAIAAIYFVVNFILSLVARYLQKRLSAGGGTIS
ncbi:MAG: amino acid ABC transporter permease [Actinomycetia bacterium]|nr:amino acid ABC transporter permease [Actinomycetes bacterium]